MRDRFLRDRREGCRCDEPVTEELPPSSASRARRREAEEGLADMFDGMAAVCDTTDPSTVAAFVVCALSVCLLLRPSQSRPNPWSRCDVACSQAGAASTMSSVSAYVSACSSSSSSESVSRCVAAHQPALSQSVSCAVLCCVWLLSRYERFGYPFASRCRAGGFGNGEVVLFSEVEDELQCRSLCPAFTALLPLPF